MATILNASDTSFSKTLSDLLENKIEISTDVNGVVRAIIDDVSKHGDDALFRYTSKFDRFEINADNIRISNDEIEYAYRNCSHFSIDSLKLAAKRIKEYHLHQKPDDLLYTDDDGITLGWKWTAIDAVGAYVPGGLAAYPSTVLMNAIPAYVAGVRRIAMVVPTPDGKINPLVLAAAKIAGVKEIYRIGGAQAIASLAYGTESVNAVDKIVGPGNAYVAAAKMQVFGRVGIDMIAGPSEIVVISDGNTNPSWVAADLLSQAEHDKNARSILIVDNEEFANRVMSEVESFLKTLSRADIAQESWNNNGIVIIAKNLKHATDISNIIAPEHLEIATDNPEEIMPHITNAGAIFLGRYTPEAIGDYTAGPSHVLPTSGSARFSSGLSVYDFLKRSSIIKCNKESFVKIKNETFHIADKEGLSAHALSITVRD